MYHKLIDARFLRILVFQMKNYLNSKPIKASYSDSDNVIPCNFIHYNKNR